jgi:hypothetical protein
LLTDMSNRFSMQSYWPNLMACPNSNESRKDNTHCKILTRRKRSAGPRSSVNAFDLEDVL